MIRQSKQAKKKKSNREQVKIRKPNKKIKKKENEDFTLGLNIRKSAGTLDTQYELAQRDGKIQNKYTWEGRITRDRGNQSGQGTHKR